jgi:hypothetical protein
LRATVATWRPNAQDESTFQLVIRVDERNQAFLLNIVENRQREELSGRERIRAIEMLP